MKAGMPSGLYVGIATRGRAGVLTDTLQAIAAQTRRPDGVVVCHTGPDDIVGLSGAAADMDVQFIAAPPGLPRQRNAILDHLHGREAVLFLDDDFLMAPGYVAATLDALQRNPDVVVTTGDLIADGVKGPGYSGDAARALIVADLAQPQRNDLVPATHGYGCNMAIRADVARRHAIRFDERLPLYAWSEDMDFTHRLGRHGSIRKLQAARGVHLGTKTGRTSGDRLGYSQVANPIYLCQKGSYTPGHAIWSVGRNMAANMAKSVWSEPYIDRRGRLRGNFRAFGDILLGRLAPERILEF